MSVSFIMYSLNDKIIIRRLDEDQEKHLAKYGSLAVWNFDRNGDKCTTILKDSEIISLTKHQMFMMLNGFGTLMIGDVTQRLENEGFINNIKGVPKRYPEFFI